LSMVRSPFYAGAYAFGRRESRTRVVDGRATRTSGHHKPMARWTALIREHHPGYISWEQFERNQRLLEENTHMKGTMTRKAGRGGQCLLAGLLRCARCGRMLHVMYGRRGYARYECRQANRAEAAPRCIGFSARRPDETVSAEILTVVQGSALAAAIEAGDLAEQHHHDQHRALALELEQAHYHAALAARRYEAVDPDNRLVATELEARWNGALRTAGEIEQRLHQSDVNSRGTMRIPDKETLCSLAQNLPAVWNAETTDMRLKQRIVRILIQEIVADVDDQASEILLVIHWAGGRHSELRVKKNPTGEHNRCTSMEAIEIIRQMAGRYPDDQIAATLNRLGLKTGSGNTWIELRIRTARSYQSLPAYDPEICRRTLTLAEASDR